MTAFLLVLTLYQHRYLNYFLIFHILQGLWVEEMKTGQEVRSPALLLAKWGDNGYHSLGLNLLF